MVIVPTKMCVSYAKISAQVIKSKDAESSFLPAHKIKPVLLPFSVSSYHVRQEATVANRNKFYHLGVLLNENKLKMKFLRLVNVFLWNVFVTCQTTDIDLVTKWLDKVSRVEELPFRGMEGGEKYSNMSPLVRNVICGKSHSKNDKSSTDNFYFENGKFDVDGKFSGPGTLYIFDKLEGHF